MSRKWHIPGFHITVQQSYKISFSSSGKYVRPKYMKQCDRLVKENRGLNVSWNNVHFLFFQKKKILCTAVWPTKWTFFSVKFIQKILLQNICRSTVMQEWERTNKSCSVSPPPHLSSLTDSSPEADIVFEAQTPKSTELPHSHWKLKCYWNVPRVTKICWREQTHGPSCNAVSAQTSLLPWLEWPVRHQIRCEGSRPGDPELAEGPAVWPWLAGQWFHEGRNEFGLQRSGEVCGGAHLGRAERPGTRHPKGDSGQGGKAWRLRSDYRRRTSAFV